MDIFAEEFRAEMLRKINSRINSKKDAMIEAEKEAAKLREEYKKLQDAKLRLDLEECPTLVCPHCFYMSHASSPLRPIPFRTEDIDLFECKVCKRQWEKPEKF